MGASESIQVTDDEEQEQDTNVHDHDETSKFLEKEGKLIQNVQEKDPEVSPSPSSLSPQLSSFSTPHFDKDSIPFVPSESINNDPTTIEIYVICHGECHMKLKPNLVGGRCPEAALTPNGKRQARALAVFLKSQGLRFNAIYTSPLDRARATAIPVCQEMNLPEHTIQTSNALNDMSQGIWEGCPHSDVYTPLVVSIMERLQPDFCAPSGETLRQVEFRMIEFLNTIVACLPETPPQLDLPVKAARQGPPKRKSSKSRLHMVSAGGDHEADDEMSPRVPSKHRERLVFPESSVKNIDGITNNNGNSNNNSETNSNRNINSNSCSPPYVASCCIGVFTHSVPIQCLVTGILGCTPIMSNKICIKDSSITVLRFSQIKGWEVQRVNDTCHLRLM